MLAKESIARSRTGNAARSDDPRKKAGKQEVQPAYGFAHGRIRAFRPLAFSLTAQGKLLYRQAALQGEQWCTRKRRWHTREEQHAAALTARNLALA